MHWNADLYDGKHRFVSDYGSQMLGKLCLKPGMRVLDLGCGTGILTKRIADFGADVLGVDASESMIDTARRNYPELSFLHADATRLTFDREFDAVFSNAVFHWIADQPALLRCVQAALKPGGRIVCEFGAAGCLDSVYTSFARQCLRLGYRYKSAFYFPTAETYRQLLETAGLTVDEIFEYDRPTPLEAGRKGLSNLVCQFLADDVSKLSENQRRQLFEGMEAELESTLWDGERWIADYRRLQFAAHRP